MISTFVEINTQQMNETDQKAVSFIQLCIINAQKSFGALNSRGAHGVYEGLSPVE